MQNLIDFADQRIVVTGASGIAWLRQDPQD